MSWDGGEIVTYTASVSDSGGPPFDNGGTVTFMDNGTLAVGTATLSGGQATYTTSSVPVGTNNIAAVYSGDSNFAREHVEHDSEPDCLPGEQHDGVAFLVRHIGVRAERDIHGHGDGGWTGTAPATGTVTFFEDGPTRWARAR